jgi:phospholipid/cholesterol/gamma-HCH transport system substrate-binding protein
MSISNETKIGVLAVVAVVALVLGFNFLKGSSLFEHSKKIYAVFNNVEGMEVSNAVQINGLQVGSVEAINESDKDLKGGIVVTIVMKKDVHIPVNSVGVISSGLISASSIIIHKGDSTVYLKDGDTLITKQQANLISQVQQALDPVILQVGGTLESLDSLIQVIGSLFNPKLKNNFSAIIANLATSSASLQTLLNAQTGQLAQAMHNTNEFTANLAKNNDHFTHTMENVEKATSNLAAAKIPETVQTLQSTVSELRAAIAKMNSTDGSLGLLLNDKRLYQNLESTSRSLNTLLDDVRLHPKRYVSLSVFGRKDKGGALTAPVGDSSVSKPANK